MPATIADATKDGPVTGLPGPNRAYLIGDIAYRFKRDGGPMATGKPVLWVDGKWQDTQLGQPITRGWLDLITVLED